MAEVIGLENYLELTRYFGGENPYIPKFDELVKDPRNRELRSKYNGYNVRELSREYHLSERYIRILTADLRKRQQARPPDGQLHLGGF